MKKLIIDNVEYFELRSYEKYKEHLDKLVRFGSLTKYMRDKYLKNFLKEEHTEAIVYDIGISKIKSIFPEIIKEDLDDMMIGYLMVADLGIKLGKSYIDTDIVKPVKPDYIGGLHTKDYYLKDEKDKKIINKLYGVNDPVKEIE